METAPGGVRAGMAGDFTVAVAIMAVLCGAVLDCDSGASPLNRRGGRYTP